MTVMLHVTSQPLLEAKAYLSVVLNVYQTGERGDVSRPAAG